MMRLRSMGRRVAPAVVGALAGAACSAGAGETKSAARGAAVEPLPVMTAAALRAVPVHVSVEVPVQASVYAWRDFLPIADAPTGRQDLRVSVQVRGGVVSPKTLSCAGAYLVHGDSVFASPQTEQRSGDGPGAVECLIRGGPAWPVNGEIHVILRVLAGDRALLIRRETTIDATS
jgi:hypothetical protein